VAGSLFACAIASLLMWQSFYQTLKSTERLATVALSRDLRREFRETKVCDDIIAYANKCELIYISSGGPFDYPKINDCLNFLDDIGYYVHSGALDLELADHLFGAAIVELTVNPELSKYIRGVSSRETEGLSRLTELADRLKASERHAKLLSSALSSCPQPSACRNNASGSARP
jgi:hypothetical protein